MSFSRLWAFLAVALPVLASLIATLSSVDLAYHLRAAADVLDTGRIATTDSFTFTVAGQPWFNQQWGAQVVLAGAFRIAGWPGLVLLRASLIGVLYGLVFTASRRQGASTRAAALLTLAAFGLSAPALALRPQLFGMVLFAVTLVIVVERRRRPALIWAVPVIALVWANVHGSFFLAPIVLGLAWLVDLHDRVAGARRVLLAALASAVTASITPYGPAVWLYAAGLSTNSRVTQQISEWQPTSIREPIGLAFFASVLALGAFLARRGRPTPWPALAWFGTFIVVGAWAARGAAWWPLSLAVGSAGLIGTGFLGCGAPAATSAERPTLRLARRLNAAVAILVVAAGVVLLPMWRSTDARTGAPSGVVADAPAGITSALRRLAQRGDRIVHPQPWGSWFELAVPQGATVVDSRVELFPDDVWSAYETVAGGRPGWREQLDAWGATIVVAGRDQPALIAAVSGDPAWLSAYSDEDGAVLVRADRTG